MPVPVSAQQPDLQAATANLESLLVRDETVEATAVQRRMFALTHRRVMVAATNNRLIAVTRKLIGGFEYTDVRWQDLKEAHISVGIFGATLHLVAEQSSDLASAPRVSRTLVYTGLRPDEARAVYRICQAQDQAWREKRRVREMEELRARSGGVHIVGAPSLAGETVDPVVRLDQARRMLASKLISDAEFEAIKAKILSGS